jgi:hypothetical protein
VSEIETSTRKEQARTATERAALRMLQVSNRRPDPPRELRFVDNLLSWLAPPNTTNITHYRIRIDQDGGAPDYEVSAGQRSLQLFRGDTFTVSSYNAISGLESRRVGFGAAYGQDGNQQVIPPVPPDSQFLYFTALTAVLSDPNDFGLRFWIVKAFYNSTIADITGVAVYCANPTTADPVKVGEGPCSSSGSYDYWFAQEVPAETAAITVWLSPITTTFGGALEVVASPHRNVNLTPVPNDTVGVELTGHITSPACAVTEVKDANGLTRTRLAVTFTAPSDPRWGGVEIDAKRPGPIWEQLARTPVAANFLVDCPITAQTWRIFFRSYDKAGRTNSLAEGAGGTPYVDISIGSDAGKFDAAKIDQTKLSSALQIAAGVLGIKPLGITEDLLGAFAVSQAKLAYAPIIDAVRIENLAVGTGHIQLLAITTGLIANAAILEAKIGDLQVTSGKIASLAVDKITSWSGASIAVGAGFTFTTTGGYSTGIGASGIHTTGDVVADMALRTKGPVQVYVNSSWLQMLNTDGGVGCRSFGCVGEYTAQANGFVANSGYGYMVGAATVIDSSGNVKSANGVATFTGAVTSITITNGIVSAIS